MSKRREYHVHHRAKKAALFILACGLNPDTRVKIPDAMRIKGYSNVEAVLLLPPAAAPRARPAR